MYQCSNDNSLTLITVKVQKDLLKIPWSCGVKSGTTVTVHTTTQLSYSECTAYIIRIHFTTVNHLPPVTSRPPIAWNRTEFIPSPR